MATTVSVFEDLAFRKIKKGLRDKFDELLREAIDVGDAPQGIKDEATKRGLEMIQRATEEFIASRSHQ